MVHGTHSEGQQCQGLVAQFHIYFSKCDIPLHSLSRTVLLMNSLYKKNTRPLEFVFLVWLIAVLIGR